MSAIAGLIRLDGTAPDRATLQRMQAVLAPFGEAKAAMLIEMLDVLMTEHVPLELSAPDEE